MSKKNKKKTTKSPNIPVRVHVAENFIGISLDLITQGRNDMLDLI